jgi:hypothetical protein
MKSVRQPIVDLINEVIDATPPIFIDGDENLDRARLANQLISGGYLSGSPALNGEGIPVQVCILDVTIEGRRLCEEMEEEIRNAQFAVKAGKTLKKGTLLLFGGLCSLGGGVVAAVVTSIILKKFGLQ